jgi:hypothetical protein
MLKHAKLKSRAVKGKKNKQRSVNFGHKSVQTGSNTAKSVLNTWISRAI